MSVVVLEPDGEQSEGDLGAGERSDLDVVALQRADEGLGDAVALGALHGCEAELEAELTGEDASVLGRVGRAVVAEHLHELGRAVSAEARLDGLQHHVADIRAADPGVRYGAPSDDLSVMRVDDERTPNDIAVAAGDLEAVRAASQRGATGSSPLVSAGSSA